MAKFIVIDGLDGCGKALQSSLLKERLIKQGKHIESIDFPNYNSDSSAPVRMYLNKELGDNPKELNPYMCSSFYAVDRCIQYIIDWKNKFEMDNNTIILADRYLSANVIFQGGKYDSIDRFAEFAKWCYDYECNRCGLPVEDITIILTVQPEISQQLLSNRYKNNESKKDLHESNLEYLKDLHKKIITMFELIDAGKLNLPSKWIHIDCNEYKDGKPIGILDKQVINDKIMECIQGLLDV